MVVRAPADGAAVAWLPLDQKDNDPALLWTYVVTAVRAAVPEVGEAGLQLLTSSAQPDAALAGPPRQSVSPGPHGVVRCTRTSRRRGHHRGRARRRSPLLTGAST